MAQVYKSIPATQATNRTIKPLTATKKEKVKTTVEAAVLELIKEGERKGVWDFKYPPASPTPWWKYDEWDNQHAGKIGK